MEAPRNVVRYGLKLLANIQIEMAEVIQVLVSVPSLLDPSLAPPGKHVIHAYVPATEPYDNWKGLSRSSEVK